AVGHQRQRTGGGGVVADQQHRFALAVHRGRHVQQRLGKAAAVRRHRTRGTLATGADGPVAGRGVVHGVVEAGGRKRQRRGGQRIADVVGNAKVAVGGGKHRGQQ